MKALITKTSGDYEDSKSGQFRTGKFWKVEVDEVVIRRAGSVAKKDIEEVVRNNFGWDIEIKWVQRV